MFHQTSHQSLLVLLFSAILIFTVLCDNDKDHLSQTPAPHAHSPRVEINHIKPPAHQNHARTVQAGRHSRLAKHSKQTLRRTTIHRHNSHHHKLANAQLRHAHAHAQSKATHKIKSNIAVSKESYVSASGSKTMVSISRLTSSCGSADPVSSITTSGGPNGSQDFFNCGITSGGWAPADVKMNMIKTVSLEVEPAKTTFAPCQQYNAIFEKYGAEYGVPPIFLAAFAMQESSCKANIEGDNGGAFGLMQITSDKCGGAPGGDCSNPDYNVKMGAKTFADGLSAAGGNVLVALGAYNGWTKGLTKSQATAAKNTGCCVCQQNLDYLQQFLNGWILGLDPYTKKLGIMRNLESC